MQPSGQSTRARAPCAVACDALRSQSSNLSLDASAYQRIISNNSCTYDEQEKSRRKKGLTVSSITCDRCWHLD